MRSSRALVALAEDPERFVEPPEGTRQILTDSYCVVIGPQSRWAGVCSMRLPTPATDLQPVFAEIDHLVAGAGHVLWNVGSSATPSALADRLRGLGLRGLGLRDPDPPMDPGCAAMVLTDEPPGVDGIDVRRVRTLEEHRAGLEIMLAAATWTDAAAADERARAAQTYERRNRRGGYQWLAWQAGKPVAYALADRTDAGLFLSGGATLAEARGRGCYRALVRARWDEAARLGLPGLAVQAQHTTSAPILRNLGFDEVATVHTLQS
jgi:GNAT superfamily N-acetyltransferase